MCPDQRIGTDSRLRILLFSVLLLSPLTIAAQTTPQAALSSALSGTPVRSAAFTGRRRWPSRPDYLALIIAASLRTRAQR